MKKLLYCVITLVIALLIALPAFAEPVSQGKTISYDPEKKTIVIDEYDTQFSKDHKYGQSTGKQGTYDTTGTLIGIVPKAGDIVRIAYEEKDNKKHAIRIMNVSKQDIMKK